MATETILTSLRSALDPDTFRTLQENGLVIAVVVDPRNDSGAESTISEVVHETAGVHPSQSMQGVVQLSPRRGSEQLPGFDVSKIRSDFREDDPALAKFGPGFRSFPSSVVPNLLPVEVNLEARQRPASVQPRASTKIAQMQDKAIITRGGVRFFPLQLAAWVAQVNESTIRSWIEEKVKFEKRTIETHSSITKAIYVSEDSVRRMSMRFVKWPSGNPVEDVRIGETDDRSGYIGTGDAARIVGVSNRTMWLWASQGKAPIQAPLNVIKCVTSEHFYVLEKDVFELSSLVPRSGIQRGRRPRAVAEP